MRDDERRTDLPLGAEYPMIRWLERTGYSVSYVAGVDTALRPEVLEGPSVFRSVGHDEYWTKRDDVRANGMWSESCAIRIPQAYGALRLWRSTAAATLPAGGVLSLPVGVLGYEWDVDEDKGFRRGRDVRVTAPQRMGCPAPTPTMRIATTTSSTTSTVSR
ncbi:MAG: hypothetical protein HOQ18_00645 [Dermatophilaceae bacterium]|nr:hypothetical protein [Dermatophilaceae bacterium]